MPNAQNIPISTLHGNIWYHLGLAYYLKHDFTHALTSFINCMRTSSNDDNIVSATHWIYTIMCRVNKRMDADNVLNRIQGDFKIIENVSYHRLCLLYKGVLSPEQAIEGIEEGPARDAIDYGIARWYACQGQDKKCQEILYDILSRPGWASFGYIAAEADVYDE